MSKLQPVRGTHDLYGETVDRYVHVMTHAWKTAELYGFEEIIIPIFEFAEVFARSMGETSDVIAKEMYVFEDRNGEKIALRPEGTAGVIRAVLSNGLQQNLPLRYYYIGPMFRYERPQKGRQRQFHQFGAEYIGVDNPLADVEVIALGAQFLDGLGLKDRVQLHINTLGDAESRAAYRAALVDYFSGHKNQLSEDSLARLEKNPLRILDSKDEGDRKIVTGAPQLHDYLNDVSRDFWQQVCAGLDDIGIAYEIDQKLVRGLDYYCHTVFEFVTNDLGAQGTVLAGGRYDGLMQMLGGPVCPSVGFAAGIERLMMMVENVPDADAPVVVIPVDDKAVPACLRLVQDLRQADVKALLSYGGKVGKQMQRADKAGAQFVVLMGDEEIQNSQATVKNMKTGNEQKIALDQVAGLVKE